MITLVASALVPVFFVLALGYWAGWKRLVDNQQVRSLNVLVMNFTLPAALFIATAQTPRAELAEETNLIVVLAVSMWAIYAINYFLQRRVWAVGPGECSVRALTVGLPNYAAIGLPLLGSVLGPKSAVDVAIAIAAGSTLISPVTLVILAGQKAGSQSASAAHRLAHVGLHVIRRPVVLGPVLGVAVSLAGWHLPPLSIRALNLVGQATPGAALFLTGLVLSAQPIRLDLPVFLGVLLKNLLQPLLAFAVVLLLGMTGPSARAAVLLTAIPAGFFGILFGLAHDVKSSTAGSTLALSSISAVVTLTLAILFTAGMQ